MTARDYPPLTPGELLLEEFMKPLDISANDLSVRAGLPLAQVRDLLAGRTAITADMARALGAAFEMSAQFWNSVQAQYDDEVRADLV